uniref:Glycine cleavage system H protein n=1 Tax=Candidatus Kentrum sp. MB TaxID=2138164 RepID=A0A451BD32_9GAMM|nr:MAG: glycine cleavage system H protein [Candidatus Kentron sp. MB]VFK32417.1 MAG: glycine cleavage system H protein [Candidatus Kentron sp. MB]VFK76194.1 MAG: glycine cleavage system H protein [Candidatus Kentron sp. MB]
MTNVPEQLRYAKTHEWIKEEDDGSITIGITDHAQELLGDIVYVEAPSIGLIVEAEEDIAVVESVKAASDIYSPVAGEVIEVNQALAETPELLNTDPYQKGWILRLRPSAPIPEDALLSAFAYAELAASESESE